MLSLAIIKKELRENIWTFVVVLALLVANAIISTASFELLKKMFETQAAPQNLPSFAKGYLDVMKDFNSYTWSGWFDKNYIQYMTVAAVLLGMGNLAKEVAGDTIGFLLTKPYTRIQVFASKFMAGVILITALAFISSLFNHIFAALYNSSYNISLGKMMLGALNSIPGLLIIYAVAVIFSTVFNDRIKAGLVSGAVAIALTVPSFFPDYADYSIYKYFVASEIYNEGVFPWLTFLYLVLGFVALFAIGNQIFKGRQY